MQANSSSHSPAGHATLLLSELLTPAHTPHARPTPAALHATRAAFAPGGSGLLLLSGLPAHLEALRLRLLARAPHLPPRAALLAEHGLGSDTSGPASPQSATLQLAWAAGGLSSGAAAAGALEGEGGAAAAAAASPLRRELEALGCAWAALCAAVAAACDAWLPGGPCLAAALEGAREAKARLIYYPAGPPQHPWQAWHKDYGLFTAVSAPLHWGAEGQLLDPMASAPPGAGLHVLCSSSSSSGGGSGGGGGSGARVLGAGVEPGCLAIQVGEAAQVLSGGALAAVAHCVLRPALEGCSRATFVVFCQPPAALPLAPCAGGLGEEASALQAAAPHAAAAAAAAASVYAAEEVAWDAGHLDGVLPRLAGRWPGAGGLGSPCTFTAFGKSTVKAYYGKAGTQRK